MDNVIETGFAVAEVIIKGTAKMEMHKKWRQRRAQSGKADSMTDKFEIASLRSH